ncbi:MAG TPA: hypothetical protein VFB08_04530 [Burkholderiales bacterium]|nr:hypothetical protein [Burkholderiales bacterium]
MPEQIDEGHAFEKEVRVIARELWPEAVVAGAITLDARERDGFFETEDCIHLIEATISRLKSKADEDVKKLVALAHRLQKARYGKSVKCWFITKDEPTPDQHSVAFSNRNLVTVESFAHFRTRLIDSSGYLLMRDKYPFGSVRDPGTGNLDVKVDYVPLEMLEVGSGKLWSVQMLSEALATGGHFVLLGDYGAGKSMTLRQLYADQKKLFAEQKIHRFPVYLNLRDHVGQEDATEILERHAKKIGFAKPHHLVRAWRAGYVTLLLDGFDEIPALGIQGLWRKLHDGRFRAMQGVRQFIREQPFSAGLAVTGRAHFFDSEKERRIALGLNARTQELSLSEFSDLQVKEFLKRAGVDGRIPSWLPSRPLLVGYLAARGFLRQFVHGDASTAEFNDPAKGWDMLLDSISAREAEIEPGIDGPTVRAILERLATTCRRTQSGFGPLNAESIVSAFEAICGYQPDPKAMMLLQRLPGLGIENPQEESRAFIDQDLASVCRAGDVTRFAANPYGVDPKIFSEAEHCIGRLGIQVAADRLKKMDMSQGKFNAAIKRAADANANAHVICDLAITAIENSWDVTVPCFVNGVSLQELELRPTPADLSMVAFQSCYFGVVDVDTECDTKKLPTFLSCLVGKVEGRVSKSDLPPGKFDDDCLIEGYGLSAKTTDAIVDMSLPIGVRVALTILKKLYMQSGGGRRDGALYRGLDHNGKRAVPSVLRLLKREGLAIESHRGTGVIWLPVRGEMSRVGKLVASPNQASDPLLKKCADIS